MKHALKYLFGPVPSRRLGRSLGIDIVPYKTCTYDCIYCQLGRTSTKTAERRSFMPCQDVIDELRLRLSSCPPPDYITISGSGEPTLNADLGGIIAVIKTVTEIPLAVLTNGSLLWMEEVRKDLLRADLVIPSLDAGTPETFERINRPDPSIDFQRMVEGIGRFSREYSGKLWIEIFFVEGINDSDDEISRIIELTRRIRHDRIQLNTVTRPPAEATSRRLNPERMEEIARRFEPPAEVIADFHAGIPDAGMGCMDDIESMCRRRPCTLDDISRALGLNPNEVAKYLQQLQRLGAIKTKTLDGRTYFTDGIERR